MSTNQAAHPIRLYRHVLSGHAHRVELFLNLLGLEHELIEVDLRSGEQRRPEFLAINPFGQVPVIDDGGLVLADSNAILVYLAMRYGDEYWLPRDAVGAARVQRWLSAAAGPLATGAAAARWTRVAGLQRDTSAAIEQAQGLFRVVDETLAAQGSEFLVGARPTIADVSLYTYTAHAPEGNVALDGYPALSAWLRRIEALAGFVPMRATPVGLVA